jgi:hypothetical protein
MQTTSRPPYSPAAARPLPARDVWSRPPAPDDPEPGTLFDVRHFLELVGFVVAALRRHRRAALSALAAVSLTAVVAALILPRSYAVETKLLAQRSLVMPALSNPRRNVPKEEDTPTRLASEAIINHTNLVAIVNATGLVAHSREHQPTLARLRDRALAAVFGAPTREQQVERLVGLLTRNMWVTVGEGTVTIGVVWRDPNMAYRIVQAAQENFFEQRHSDEIALISESINILEQHATDVNSEIRSSLDSMSLVRAGTPGPDRAPFVAALRRSAPSAAVISAQTRLEAVRRTVGDLEQFRNRRLAEMQAQLADQRNTFGPAHPQIENTEQLIRSLSADSPQLQQLRREELELRATLGRLGADQAPVAGASTTDPLMAMAALRGLERLQRDSVLNERLQYARSRLKIAVSSYEDLLTRLDAARIELQTTRASFKYKYGVISPARVPTAPIKPRPMTLILGGVVLGTMLGVLIAVALDLASGRVLHVWQIQRSLGLPVLGEVRAG